MLSDADLDHAIGSTAYDNDEKKIGKVGQIFVDDHSGQPAFVTVNTGLFGTKESFAPIADATFDGESLRLPFSKDQIKDAPNVDLDGGHLSPDDEARIFEHYGYSAGSAVEGGAPSPDAGENEMVGDQASSDQAADQLGGQAPPAPREDAAVAEQGEAMTLSEERVQAGTMTEESGRARLRKYVTTDTETVTVPVRKEHAVLEREPIAEGETADGAVIGEEEHEVVLHEERAVVGTTTEAVETVRLGTETSVEDETVQQEVRKEHVEVDGDVSER